MDNAAAEELGLFRARIAQAHLRELLPIITTVLDDCIDILRVLPGPTSPAVEMLAALAAELHRRNTSIVPAGAASLVGNA